MVVVNQLQQPQLKQQLRFHLQHLTYAQVGQIVRVVHIGLLMQNVVGVKILANVKKVHKWVQMMEAAQFRIGLGTKIIVHKKKRLHATVPVVYAKVVVQVIKRILAN
jgi:hypothetical protein